MEGIGQGVRSLRIPIDTSTNQDHEDDYAKMPLKALFTVVEIEISLNVQQEGIKWIMVHNATEYYTVIGDNL